MRQHCARFERNGQRSLTVFDTTVRPLLRACFFASVCQRTHCETTRLPRRGVRFAFAFRKPFTALGVAEGPLLRRRFTGPRMLESVSVAPADAAGLASLQADRARIRG